jgi:hypothetical protein
LVEVFAFCPRLFVRFMGISWALSGARTRRQRAEVGHLHDDRKYAE